MSVTAVASGNIAPTGNRNADLWAAWWAADCCGRCGAELTGTIYRIERWYIGRRYSGPSGPVPVCGSCFEYKRGYMASPWAFTAPTPCEACGRPVVSRHRWDRLYVYCSERCSRRVYNRNRYTRRAESRPSDCSACGGPMSPSRSDARYCSSACRQRAYRQRKRLAERDR